MRVTAVFDAAEDQVAQARYFAEAMVAGWPVADDVVMVVGEFAANAVVHSASGGGGKFWVHLETVPGEYVWVEVRDQGGSWVRRAHADGRPHGLEIVALLAADCGVDGDARAGWISWARLDLPESGGKPPVDAACGQVAARRLTATANGHADWTGAAGAAAHVPARRNATAGLSRRGS